MALESIVELEVWKIAVIASMYNGKWERVECENDRGISLVSVDRVHND